MSSGKNTNHKRLSPWLWVIPGAILGLAIGGLGTEVRQRVDVNGGESVVRAKVLGLVVHERKLTPGAFESVVQTWGYGVPVFFTLAGGIAGFVLARIFNHRSARCCGNHRDD